jgi:putative glycerol-1-phosphate prenyltransferase
MYEKIFSAYKNRRSLLAVLLDPDKEKDLGAKCRQIEEGGADLIFIGSSLLLENEFDNFCSEIKRAVPEVPLIIFPGSEMQLSPYADAVLFLSLLSSRNAEMIIGKQVHAAPLVKKMELEAIGTAYLLIESGSLTSAQYMSHSLPIPREKKDIALAHALAAEILGFKAVYLEGGSGAEQTVPNEMIELISQAADLPLIVGGGIKNAETAAEKAYSGATIVVIGNHFEEKDNVGKIREFAEAVHSGNRK